MSNYKEIMQRKSDLQLLEIVNYDYENYDKEAVASAKEELDLRNISTSEIEALNFKINESIENKKLRETNLNNLVKGGKDSISKTIDAINPVTSKNFKTDCSLPRPNIVYNNLSKFPSTDSSIL